MLNTTLTRSDAQRALAEDDQLLRDAIAGLGPDELTAPRTIDGRPIGDSCESLRDLVAHHTMWREIDLAVIVDALGGRRHWSTTARWSDRDTGARLNRSGVAAGRVLHVDDVLDRFESSSASLLAVFDRIADSHWAESIFAGERTTLGEWLQTHLSVPGQSPFRHATFHLRAAGPHGRQAPHGFSSVVYQGGYAGPLFKRDKASVRVRLFVRTDESGEIVSVFWPNEPAEGAPSRAGVLLSAGERVHEVAVPEELYADGAAPDFFDRYRLDVEGTDQAVLSRRSPQ